MRIEKANKVTFEPEKYVSFLIFSERNLRCISRKQQNKFQNQLNNKLIKQRKLQKIGFLQVEF